MKLTKPFTGILAFFIVLLAMPLGHAAMILMEHAFGRDHVFGAAVVLGLSGVVFLIIGSRAQSDIKATFNGLFAGLFIWTGWIEFAHVYIAHRYNIAPLMEGGQVVTKPEYLVMPASTGFMGFFLLYYLFNTQTNCTFFAWIQRTIKIPGRLKSIPNREKNFALVTAIELIMVLWTFYLVLLFTYDNNFFGDRHIVTYLVAFGSLIWSLFLMRKLLKVRNLGYAIRYAIPTVIIFWNFIEILGRWNILNEIWIRPMDYLLEVVLILSSFIVLTVYALTQKLKERSSSI